jgi:predicted dehydrogenase
MSKILLVSLGSIGRRHLKNTHELLPDAEIAIYRLYHSSVSEVPEGVNQVFYTIDDARAFKPDAVIISSPASDHVANAVDFMQNGADVFIEKPLAVTHKETSELLSVSRDSNQFAMVGYVLRFQPIFHFIRQIINNGELGQVRTVRVEVGQYLPDWRPGSDYKEGVSAQKALGGGVLLELSHELDYSTWLFGMPDHIICSSGKLSDLDIDVEDSACVIMEYGKLSVTKRVVVQVDFLQRVANMTIQIVGSEATFYADLVKEEAHIVSPDHSGPYYLEAPSMTHGNEMYLRQFDFFFSQSINGYKPKFDDTNGFTEFVTLERAGAVLKLVDQAKKSNNDGIRVKFAD